MTCTSKRTPADDVHDDLRRGGRRPLATRCARGPGAGRWGASAPSAGLASPPGSPGCLGQCRQHFAERGVDLEVGERVAAGRALVDDRDRDPRLPGPVHEP